MESEAKICVFHIQRGHQTTDVKGNSGSVIYFANYEPYFTVAWHFVAYKRQ